MHEFILWLSTNWGALASVFGLVFAMGWALRERKRRTSASRIITRTHTSIETFITQDRLTKVARGCCLIEQLQRSVIHDASAKHLLEVLASLTLEIEPLIAAVEGAQRDLFRRWHGQLKSHLNKYAAGREQMKGDVGFTRALDEIRMILLDIEQNEINSLRRLINGNN